MSWSGSGMSQVGEGILFAVLLPLAGGDQLLDAFRANGVRDLVHLARLHVEPFPAGRALHVHQFG